MVDIHSPVGEPFSIVNLDGFETREFTLHLNTDGVTLLLSFPSTQARAAFWASVASEAAGALEAEAL
mgnify:CR=1 FL=1